MFALFSISYLVTTVAADPRGNSGIQNKWGLNLKMHHKATIMRHVTAMVRTEVSTTGIFQAISVGCRLFLGTTCAITHPGDLKYLEWERQTLQVAVTT